MCVILIYLLLVDASCDTRYALCSINYFSNWKLKCWHLYDDNLGSREARLPGRATCASPAAPGAGPSVLPPSAAGAPGAARSHRSLQVSPRVCTCKSHRYRDPVSWLRSSACRRNLSNYFSWSLQLSFKYIFLSDKLNLPHLAISRGLQGLVSKREVEDIKIRARFAVKKLSENFTVIFGKAWYFKKDLRFPLVKRWSCSGCPVRSLRALRSQQSPGKPWICAAAKVFSRSFITAEKRHRCREGHLYTMGFAVLHVNATLVELFQKEDGVGLIRKFIKLHLGEKEKGKFFPPLPR